MNSRNISPARAACRQRRHYYFISALTSTPDCRPPAASSFHFQRSLYIFAILALALKGQAPHFFLVDKLHGLLSFVITATDAAPLVTPELTTALRVRAFLRRPSRQQATSTISLIMDAASQADIA